MGVDGKGEDGKKHRLLDTGRCQRGVKRPAERTDTERPSEVAIVATAAVVVEGDNDVDAAVVSESLVAASNDGISKSVQQEGERGVRLRLEDPIYRIMHALPRSDVLEIFKCRFKGEECERAVVYFDDAFMKNPLRKLRLQIGCDRVTGLHLFFPKLHHHRNTLRLLDLSRNDMDEDDVATLTQLLELRGESPSCGTSSLLEVLDLSYNRRIGNRGALFLLAALRHNDRIRAVILKGISVDDSGAVAVAPFLRQRPLPRMADDDEGVTFQETSSRRLPTFFLNLNENRIGAAGTVVLGKGLPAHVSLTVCRQRPFCNKKGPLL
ncbi:hypothetical protein TraAM80_01100 [Trypanosoma rangeli]|uniref:Uncharacterized protein n=1 Tax=Trypanosoma rangeli TaxID=5698 RepID=A0A3R7NT18_TRYRA|nr:uncharacterized protein TraAM80_01100 [Trypanosoma rangeli]RNF11169.1 hypothetical protein TraAM80_01100 [Trypanosoma rangeli]|eukprot:RNF11169.1 hypothetical protein TraAM80_01100 [Trypanosoma rangeli]